MKIIDESHSLFHQRIIACLEEYAPEPIKSLKIDLFAKKERTNTRELAWLLAVLKRKCPYDNIPWTDQNLREYVDAIDAVFHKKINDEIQMCHNFFEINNLPMTSRTDAIYEKLGISWEITHNYKGEGINTYWIEPLDDSWLSISFRLIESVNADLSYKQKQDLLKECENRTNKLYRHNLAEKNLTTELIRDQRTFCSNNPVTLIPNQLPEKVWLKYMAHYLAVSSRKYTDYGDIDYDDQKLINNAISIHKLLREKLSEILEIKLNEPALMPLAHREIADKEGILDIAVIATNPKREIPDDWSIEVTQVLGLRLLRAIPEFHYLFDIHESSNSPSTNESPCAFRENGVDEADFIQTEENLALEKTETLNNVPTIEAVSDNSQILQKTHEDPISQIKIARAKNLIRVALETWVKYLIETNTCTSYVYFKSFMTETYYKKSIRDEGETYDDGPIVKSVFCLLDKEGKHRVYFKIENNLGITGNNKSRALSSFKNIFDTIIDQLKQPSPKDEKARLISIN